MVVPNQDKRMRLGLLQVLLRDSQRACVQRRRYCEALKWNPKNPGEVPSPAIPLWLEQYYPPYTLRAEALKQALCSFGAWRGSCRP